MKTLFFTFFLCIVSQSALNAQHRFKIPIELIKRQTIRDSLKRLLSAPLADTLRVQVFNQLAYEYNELDDELALEFAQEALKLADRKNLPSQKALAYYRMADVYEQQGLDSLSLHFYVKAADLYLRINNLLRYAYSHISISLIYTKLKSYPLALEHSQLALKIEQQLKLDSTKLAIIHNNLGFIYLMLNEPDNA